MISAGKRVRVIVDRSDASKVILRFEAVVDDKIARAKAAEKRRVERQLQMRRRLEFAMWRLSSLQACSRSETQKSEARALETEFRAKLAALDVE